MTLANVLSPLVNHLWQSTAFAVVAGILTLALRTNHATTRYWLWVAASMKFLIPFSLLIGVGSYLGSTVVTVKPSAGLSLAMTEINQPFDTNRVLPDVTGAKPDPTDRLKSSLPFMLLGVWVLGTAVVLVRWILGWLRLTMLVWQAAPLTEGAEVQALESVQRSWAGRSHTRSVTAVDAIEPGLFGIIRPTLLLPKGISQQLDSSQLESVIAHELSHANRHDNLWGAIHMLVEALFWFHPVVWFIGYRLVDERERACDEDVLQRGCEPGVYAKAMLRVCELYVASPLVCVSGISGSDLKNRIVGIMTNRATIRLTLFKKMLLAATGIVVISVPILFGSVYRPRSQTRSGAFPSATEFDVASIKPAAGPMTMISAECRGIDSPARGNVALGRCRFLNIPLKWLIYMAFEQIDAPPSFSKINETIVNAPDWTATDAYDIDAKAEDPPKTTQKELFAMLQPLLASRFKFQFHRETREVSTLLLVVSKGGAKLRTFVDDQERTGTYQHPGGPLIGHRVSADKIAQAISSRMGQMVTDQTGLKGLYDFTLSWTPNENEVWDGTSRPTNSDPSGTSLLAALQEQLGLRVESGKTKMDVIVVDHVEKPAPAGTQSELQRPVAVPQPQVASLLAAPPRAFAMAQLPGKSVPSKPTFSSTFEVASIKETKSPGGSRGGCHGVDSKALATGSINIPLGRCVLLNMTLGTLMSVAYEFQPPRLDRESEISAGEPPLVRYDVDAKAENTSTATEQQLLSMLQALLADRFKLRFHKVVRDIPGYAMVLEKGGPKFKAARDDEEWSFSMTGSPAQPPVILAATKMPLSALAKQLSTYNLCFEPKPALAPVVDKTELIGLFDFTLKWDPCRSDPSDFIGVSVPQALKDQLGIRLEATKVPVEFYFMDHAEKPVTD